jgi:pimeloyl-ACP methyl ester carboxylesterase
MKEIPSHMRQPVLDNLMHLKLGHMNDFAQGAIEGLLTLDPALFVYRRNLTTRLLHSQLIGMSEADKKKYLFNTLRLLTKSPLDLAKPPRCPTLVFTGEHDTFTRPEDCLEIARSIPCSYFTTIKDADHLFHIEQPTTTCELCFQFVSDCEVDSVTGIGDYMPVGFLNSAPSFLPSQAA